MPRIVRLRFEMLSQSPDEIIDRAGFHRGTIAPYFFKQLPAGKHSVRIARQGFKQTGFQDGQLDRTAGTISAELFEIDPEADDVDDA
jgi:hypothetical protein